ncbi:porin family protein [Ulvibacter antarcticus]|uniref:Outer membrane protein with beta-barrel domain n=1 Tax=Ulvibacter antarcticus TaxID=442714 RepID=A0A3L9ZI94_9FLAO|nr:porin family protein [Ulvibacter antarcticus]RMA66432.1 outer membrane protein with beta-barrel domain [Ulvibacter antarcticus]
MKKLLLSMIALVFIFQANAQEKSVTKSLQIGAKAGVNFSTITGDNPAIKGKTGFHLGGMAEIPISEKLSVQPELLFSSQGANYKDIGSFNLNYLYVPIMGKYYVMDELSLEVGPQFGFLLSAKNKYDEDDYDLNPTTTGDGNKVGETEDVKNDVKSLDVGLVFGLGYKLDNGINFGARYNLGFLDGNNSDDASEEFKNSVIQFSVGYFFF